MKNSKTICYACFCLVYVLLVGGCETNSVTSQCSEAQQQCQGQCVALNDIHHCGMCDNACSKNQVCKFTEEGFECRDEVLTAKDCMKNQSFCNQQCIDKINDQHCGACDNDCTQDGKKCFYTKNTYVCQEDVEAPTHDDNGEEDSTLIICDQDGCHEGDGGVEIIEEGDDDPSDEFENVKEQNAILESIQAMTQETLDTVPEECQNEDTGERVQITVILKEIGFDFSRFQLAENEAQTQALRREREAQLKPLKDKIAQSAQAIGATILDDTSLLAVVTLEVSICKLEEVLTWENVLGIEYADDNLSD